MVLGYSKGGKPNVGGASNQIEFTLWMLATCLLVAETSRKPGLESMGTGGSLCFA